MREKRLTKRRLVARSIGGSLALACALSACGGPIGPVAGGRLSGTLVEYRIADWSFAEDFDLMQIETRPERPYSVNVNYYVVDGRLYVEAGRRAMSRWRRYLREDPRVRVRFGDRIYAGRALPVADPAEIRNVLPAYYARDSATPSESCRRSWNPDDCGFTGVFYRIEAR